MSRRRTSGRRWLSSRNTWQLFPVWLRQLECEQWKHLGIVRSSQGRAEKIETRGTINRWKRDAKRRWLPRPRDGRCPCRRHSKETSELETTIERSGHEDWASGKFRCASPSSGRIRERTLAHDERRTGMCPLDDMKFRINARVRLDLPVIQQGRCQHQRQQKSYGTVGARCLAQLDEQGQHAQRCLIGGDWAKLHDVGCHVVHNACCEAGLKSQREVVVPALVTERLTEPRVDVDAWGHPRLPHMRPWLRSSMLKTPITFRWWGKLRTRRWWQHKHRKRRRSNTEKRKDRV